MPHFSNIRNDSVLNKFVTASKRRVVTARENSNNNGECFLRNDSCSERVIVCESYMKRRKYYLLCFGSLLTASLQAR
jgi:hypothetical protein